MQVARSYSLHTTEQAASNMNRLVKALRFVDRLRQRSASSSAALLPVEADLTLAVADLIRDFQSTLSTVEITADDCAILGLVNGDLQAKPVYARTFSRVGEACEKSTDASSHLRAFKYCEQLLGKDIIDDSVLVSTGTASLLQVSVLFKNFSMILIYWLIDWLIDWLVSAGIVIVILLLEAMKFRIENKSKKC